MRTKVTGYLTQKRGFYYVVLNMPSDIKGKRIRKTLSTGLSTARNMTKAKEVMREMIREANAGEEVHGVMERKAVQSTAPESSSPRPDMLFSDYLQFWLQWKRSTWEEVTYSGYTANVNTWIAPYFSQRGTKLNEINVLRLLHKEKSKCSSLFTVKCLQKHKNARHRPPNFQKADNSIRPF